MLLPNCRCLVLLPALSSRRCMRLMHLMCAHLFAVLATVNSEPGMTS
jgi:hypothetical protein